jgi:uncharacterized protein (TIGR03083 family)
MPLSLDVHLSSILADAAGIRAAYEHDPAAPIPWSDRWSVGTVARHVAAAHHGVAGIIHGRPTADFGLWDTLDQPPKGDPQFPAWFEAGTRALCDTLRTTDLDEPCWTSVPGGRGVRFWLRRMTAETLVHRWDAELGAGIGPGPLDPEIAADGVDEYVTLALPALRTMRQSPAGPSMHIECTDADGAWFVQLGDDGRTSVSATPVLIEGTLRGPAGGLLLALMGRRSVADAGVTFEGDPAILQSGDVLPRA